MGVYPIRFHFEIYCSSMYETSKNEKKYGGHRTRFPARGRVLFQTFQFVRTLNIIITWYIRHLEEKMEENLMRHFSDFFTSFSTFWKARGTTSYTETCIFRRLLLSFNAQKNCQWYINILKIKRAHKTWGSPSSITHNLWKGRNEKFTTIPPGRLTSKQLNRNTSFNNTLGVDKRKIIWWYNDPL